jgi:PIN domain-containing protein
LPSENVFFTDQCLSGKAIADAIRIVSSCRTEVFADHFKLDTRDVNWLPEIGRKGWILVTKDWRIQQRPLERAAIINAGVRAFVLREASLSRRGIVELLKLSMPMMLKYIGKYQAPFIFALELTGALTPLSQLQEIAVK